MSKYFEFQEKVKWGSRTFFFGCTNPHHQSSCVVFDEFGENFSIGIDELEKLPQPKGGEWWMCELRQDCFGKNTVLHRATDEVWTLPDESWGVVWKQEDVTPKYKMVEEGNRNEV